MVKGASIIMLFYFLGECLSFLINGIVPGSMTMQTTSIRIFAESGHQDSRNLIPECLSY